MQSSSPDRKTNSKQKSTQNTTPIRIKKQTHRALRSILKKANNKASGRNVKADDVITTAISLLTDEHIKDLQEATLTNADKMDRRYKDYCSKNGFISKDQFLGKLLEVLSKGSSETDSDRVSGPLTHSSREESF